MFKYNPILLGLLSFMIFTLHHEDSGDSSPSLLTEESPVFVVKSNTPLITLHFNLL